MPKRLVCSMEDHAATSEAQFEAEVSADGDERQRVSGTVESIRHQGCTVKDSVEVGGGLSVEQTVGAVEPLDHGQTVALSLDQDGGLAFDPSGDTVGCRW